MKIKPIVMTSKKASQHLMKIKTRYSTLLKDMTLHQQKVAQFKLNKENKKQMENERKGIEKEKTGKSEMENKKMQMEMETKHQAEKNKALELEIKRSALAN